MIACNDRKQTKKRLKRQFEHSVAAKQRSGQMLLNAVLWQIIKGMAKARVEDYDESMAATLTLPREALQQVPANFALKLESDDENVSVIATFVQPKSNILLADGSNAPGDL